MSFGERLREERKRIRLNQTDFGKVGGVSKRSQISYENGETSPGAEYWEAVAKIGADVQYILTGIHSGNLDKVVDADEAIRQRERLSKIAKGKVVCERFHEEFKRLKHTTKELSEWADVAESTAIRWTQDVPIPPSKLARLEKHGYRSRYILDASIKLPIIGNYAAEVAKKEKEQSTEAGALSPRDRIWLKIGQGLSDEDRTRLQAIGITLVSARELIDKAKDK